MPRRPVEGDPQPSARPQEPEPFIVLGADVSLPNPRHRTRSTWV